MRRTHYDPLVELGVTVPPAESDFRVEGASVTGASEIGVGGDAPPGALTHPDSRDPECSFCRLQQELMTLMVSD